VLLNVLAESLRLLHPLLPLLTEEIYGKLPSAVRGSGLLITAPYPEYRKERANEKAEADFGFLQELVRLVRTLRSECAVPPDKKLRALVKTASGDKAAFLAENAALVKLLAGLGSLETAAAGSEGGGSAAGKAGAIGLVGADFEALVFVADAVDIAFLKQKFAKEIEKDKKFAAGLTQKLSNQGFLKNAPPELVAEERHKLDDTLKRTSKLESYMKDLA
jgi:valyl-tRNA synthetase